MKIAYVYDAVYPWIKGGAEKRIHELSTRLAEKGHECHIYGIRWWDGPSDMTIGDVHYHGVCSSRSLYVEEGRRSIAEALKFSISLFPPLLKGNYDLIECTQFPYFSIVTAKICSILKRKPLVGVWLEVWDDYWRDYLGALGIFGKLTEKMTARLPDKTIAISNTTKNNLIKIGVRESKITVIPPSGIDMEKIRKAKPSQKKSDVIFVGRLIKDKNVNVLLEAISLTNKNIKCLVVGDGPERKNLEKLASKLNLKSVEFHGFVDDHDEMLSLLKSSKIFALPSTREGFGIVALEANACGLPVITTDHGNNAARELIDNGKNGFKTGLSPGEMSEKITDILENDGLRNELSANSVKNSDNYGWDKIIKRHEEILEWTKR